MEFIIGLKVIIKNNRYELIALDNGINDNEIDIINSKLAILNKFEEDYNAELSDEIQSMKEDHMKEIELTKLLINEQIEDRVEDKYTILLNNEIEKNKKLEEDKERLYEILNKNEKIVNIGNIGEEYILDALEKYIEYVPNSCVERIGQNHAEEGDISLTYDCLRCIIEIKNYTNQITPITLKKFNEVYMKREQYNCGMFISIKSNFSKGCMIKCFSLKLINNKPVIYLSCVSDNIDKIYMSINVLNYCLLNNKISNVENVVDIINMSLTHLNEVELQNKRIMNNVKDSLKSLELAKSQLDKIINPNKIHEKKDKKDKVECDICGKEYVNIKNHMKIHEKI